jgi:hypothetical protein
MMAAMVALVLTFSCQGLPGAGGKDQSSAVRARAAFEALWRGELRRRSDLPKLERFDAMVEAGPTGVSSIPCRKLRDEVARTAGRGRNPSSLHGSLAALDRGGVCWEVNYDGRLRSGLAAAVAPDGEVLFVWVVPEG